jgi:D-alanyl-D-alanine carboxypeptidase
MPTDGTYGVASITKTFVAAIALQLVDEGKLSLDEPVEAWLPEIPHADEVTLAMLLGHTAGLGPWDNGDASIADLTRSFTPEELLATQLQTPPSGQPSERFYYTNTGYTAAGVLIERVLDQDLATVIAPPSSSNGVTVAASGRPLLGQPGAAQECRSPQEQ